MVATEISPFQPRSEALFYWPFKTENTLIVAGWGFWLGVAGLLLTIVGFAITLVQLSKAKSAASAVREEVSRIRESLSQYDAAQDIAKSSYALAATRRYLSNGAWQDVSDSYEDVRRGLVQVKSSGHINDLEIISQIESASDYIQKLCVRIERGLERPPINIDVSKTRSMLRKHDELIALITSSIQRDVI